MLCTLHILLCCLLLLTQQMLLQLNQDCCGLQDSSYLQYLPILAAGAIQ